MSNSNDSISRWETPHLLDLPIREEVSEQTLDELRSEAETPWLSGKVMQVLVQSP